VDLVEQPLDLVGLLPYGNADYLNDAGNMLCVSADTMAELKHASFEWLDDIEHKIAEFDSAGNRLRKLRYASIWQAKNVPLQGVSGISCDWLRCIKGLRTFFRNLYAHHQHVLRNSCPDVFSG